MRPCRLKAAPMKAAVDWLERYRQHWEERLDRMESYAAIQQLAARYARALDARDMAAVVALFSPHVQVGALSGRAALEERQGELFFNRQRGHRPRPLEPLALTAEIPWT